MIETSSGDESGSRTILYQAGCTPAHESNSHIDTLQTYARTYITIMADWMATRDMRHRSLVESSHAKSGWRLAN